MRFIASVACALALFYSYDSQAVTITVDSLADNETVDSNCTLREAIISANTDAGNGDCDSGLGDDVIEFSVAGAIAHTAAMPPITSVIHINGYSAPGASVNTLGPFEGSNAVLTVILDGAGAGVTRALELSGSAASGSIIEGLVINNSANAACCNQIGIFLDQVDGSSSTQIRGNFIGTDATGAVAQSKGSPNIWLSGTDGVVVGSLPLGAFEPAAVNVISGSGGNGINVIGSSNTTIRGNLIGTNAGGTAAIGNSNGIQMDGGQQNQVLDNLVSGNRSAGVYMRPDASATVIAGNRIGTTRDGAGMLGNGFSGIAILDNQFSSNLSVSEVEIAGNLIAWNTCSNCGGGIFIGAANSTNTLSGIEMTKNLVYGNSSLQIELAVPNGTNDGRIVGVTPNDEDDADTLGANRLQNFPVIETVVWDDSNELRVDFSLNSVPSRSYDLEFFTTLTCDTSGHGGAEVYLGDYTGSTDANGDLADHATFSDVVSGGYLTATATNADDGTSEFSACFPLMRNDVFADGFEAEVL